MHEGNRVMVCLPVEERDAEALLAEAARTARDLDAALCVVHVYPAGKSDPEQAARQDALARRHGAVSWYLRGADPAEPLLRFAARHRITHVILGKDGRRSWGTLFRT